MVGFNVLVTPQGTCAGSQLIVAVVVPHGTWGVAKGNELDSLRCRWCHKARGETKREIHELHGAIMVCVGWWT